MTTLEDRVKVLEQVVTLLLVKASGEPSDEQWKTIKHVLADGWVTFSIVPGGPPCTATVEIHEVTP